MTDPSCSPAHLPSQPASPASGSSFPGPATQPPPIRHSAQIPARDAPPRGFGRPKPGPFGHGEPGPRETDQLLSPRGKVTAPLRGLQPGHLQGLAGARALPPARGPRWDRTGRRLGDGEAGGPSRPAATPPPGPHPGSRTSCGVSAAPTAAHPGRDSLASERQRSARGPGEVAGGRARGSAPSTASASSTRQGGERGERRAQQPAPRTRRRARPPPPQPRGRPLRSCPRTPRSSPSRPSARPLFAAHSPSCCGHLPRPSSARTPAPFPVAQANGSAPLLHKRQGAGPGGAGDPCETGTAGDVALCPRRPSSPACAI